MVHSLSPRRSISPRICSLEMVEARETAPSGSVSKAALARAAAPMSRLSPSGCYASQVEAPTGSTVVQFHMSSPMVRSLPGPSG